MSEYPIVVKGESVCAYCGKEIESEYLTVRENHMVLNYFSYEDGEDNIFCDSYCLSESLFAETVSVEEVD